MDMFTLATPNLLPAAVPLQCIALLDDAIMPDETELTRSEFHVHSDPYYHCPRVSVNNLGSNHWDLPGVLGLNEVGGSGP